ncbi:MAG: 5'/3'-nucleotidase SurE [Candidatus Desulforudis sp.]|nr:5'/3'-nucleotidase SurE [Desulforudis sp.]
MRLLLTNDDGIFAAGLESLRLALADLAREIYIIAPDRERSATGHSITVHRPIRVREACYNPGNCRGWVVDGTPVDCVKLGLESLLPEMPDLVISGINYGPNLGTDVLYSGTVSAAMEGLINGVPALAVSLASHREPAFEYTAAFTRRLVPLILGHREKLAPGTLLNINVPPGKPVGHKITKLGNLRYANAVDRRTDPRGRDYYWMAGKPFSPDSHDPNTDIAAVRDGYISIAPVHFDLTDYRAIEVLKDWSIEWMEYD